MQTLLQHVCQHLAARVVVGDGIEQKELPLWGDEQLLMNSQRVLIGGERQARAHTREQ